MSLVPTVYRNTDAGAPVLSGQPGSLCAVLDAVLVDGYGSGGTAKLPAGWTREFSATNKRSYRNNPSTGTGRYIAVDDTASIGNARHAWLRAFESMSSVDGGIGSTPIAGNGLLAPKSLSLDSTARAWLVVATERAFYLFVDVGNTQSGWVGVPSLPLFVGDIVSRRPGDSFHFMLAGSRATDFSGQMAGFGSFLYNYRNWNGTPGTEGQYFMRGHTQIGGSVNALTVGAVDGITDVPFGTAFPHPDPVGGAPLYQRIFLIEGPFLLRGYLPGLYGVISQRPFPDGQVITDLEGQAPGTMILSKWFSWAWGGGSQSGWGNMVLLDLTSEW